MGPTLYGVNVVDVRLHVFCILTGILQRHLETDIVARILDEQNVRMNRIASTIQVLYELDYGPVDRWRQNYTDEVLARVREVKSVLEHAPFQGLYPLEAGQQRQAARRLIAWLARQSGLGPEAFKERSLSL